MPKGQADLEYRLIERNGGRELPEVEIVRCDRCFEPFPYVGLGRRLCWTCTRHVATVFPAEKEPRPSFLMPDPKEKIGP